MFRLDDPVGNILRRAAYLVRGPESYSTKTVASVLNPDTTQFSATGFLERANLRGTQNGNVPLKPCEPEPLIAAKARVCKAVGYPHLDAWEAAERPDWQRVTAAFEAA